MPSALFPFRRFAFWVGILCLGLVLLSGMLQAAHFHPFGQVDHDCALCVAAHSIAQAAPAITLHLASMATASLLLALVLTAPRRFNLFRLVSRPPPTASASPLLPL